MHSSENSLLQNHVTLYGALKVRQQDYLRATRKSFGLPYRIERLAPDDTHVRRSELVLS